MSRHCRSCGWVHKTAACRGLLEYEPSGQNSNSRLSSLFTRCTTNDLRLFRIFSCLQLRQSSSFVGSSHLPDAFRLNLCRVNSPFISNHSVTYNSRQVYDSADGLALARNVSSSKCRPFRSGLNSSTRLRNSSTDNSNRLLIPVGIHQIGLKLHYFSRQSLFDKISKRREHEGQE